MFTKLVLIGAFSIVFLSADKASRVTKTYTPLPQTYISRQTFTSAYEYSQTIFRSTRNPATSQGIYTSGYRSQDASTFISASTSSIASKTPRTSNPTTTENTTPDLTTEAGPTVTVTQATSFPGVNMTSYILHTVVLPTLSLEETSLVHTNHDTNTISPETLTIHDTNTISPKVLTLHDTNIISTETLPNYSTDTISPETLTIHDTNTIYPETLTIHDTKTIYTVTKTKTVSLETTVTQISYNTTTILHSGVISNYQHLFYYLILFVLIE